MEQISLGAELPSPILKELMRQLAFREKRAISAARVVSEQESRRVTRLAAAIVEQIQARQIQTLEFVQAALAGQLDAAQAETTVLLLKQSSAVADALLISLRQVLAGEPVEPRVLLTDFAVRQLLGNLQARLSEVQSNGAKIRFARSGALLRSDPPTLERLLRALVTYATEMGGAERIVIGCRRRAGRILIEVWVRSSSAAIATVGTNAARGLEEGRLFYDLLVSRFGALLGHQAEIACRSDRVSVFRIWLDEAQDASIETAAEPVSAASGAIIVVAEDAALRRSLAIMLECWTYQVMEVASSLELIASHRDRPLDPVCVVFDVPPAVENPDTVKARIDAMRQALGATIPAVVLRNARQVEMPELCIGLEKPVVAAEVQRSIQRLVSLTRTPAAKASVDTSRTVFFIGSDLFQLMPAPLATIRQYDGPQAFASASVLGQEGCVVVDADMPDVLLISFLNYMAEERPHLPVIVISSDARPKRVVRAMRAGALDYLRKPAQPPELQACVEHAFAVARQRARQTQRPRRAELPNLTARERNVLDGVYGGQSSKIIAYELGISQRTVEYYRAALMKKLGVSTIPDFVRLVIEAGGPAAFPTLPTRKHGIARSKKSAWRSPADVRHQRHETRVLE